jgi:ubiquinol-cytochrome c reductase cytochrome c subunit
MTTTTRPKARSKFRRRAAGLLALGVSLLSAGVIYSIAAPEPQTATAAGDSVKIQEGKQLFDNSCLSCHGDNLQGIPGRGPSLIGVGEAAVYFQVSTGRMPLARQEAQAQRKPAVYTPEQVDALGAYVQAHGGGPELPQARGGELVGGNVARGGELFRLNCANCHGASGQGGALSSGKYAPQLDRAGELDIYTAMLTGPQNMPKFSERQLSPDEKKDIIAYVKSVRDGNNAPGGHPLGGFGPVSEGLIAWIVGLAAAVGITMWIGSKA